MTDNLLDTISKEIVSDASKETVQVEQDPSLDLYDYEGIRHMLVIYMHNWNNSCDRDFIRGPLIRYVNCMFSLVCNRHNIVLKEPGQKIIDSENKEQMLDDEYLMLIPMKCSTTPYCFFIALQQVMKVLQFADLRFHLDMYMRDSDGEFVDFGSYIKSVCHQISQILPTMNGIKELLRTGTHRDFAVSMKNVKSYELFRKIVMWELFSSRGYNVDDIEMGFMRVLMRE